MPDRSKAERRPGELITRRHFVIGGALLATSGVAFARQPRLHKQAVEAEAFETWVPAKFGNWSMAGASGVVLPPPDALSDRLYDNLVTRVYAGPQASVMVLLAYNNMQDGVLQVHRPEVCYPVGGYLLTETQPLSVHAMGKSVPSNFFTATGPDRVEQVLYFTRLGAAYPRSWVEQRLAVVRENLAGRIPDGIMLRASVLSGDRAHAINILRPFTSEFVAAAAPSLQRLLVV